MARAGGVRSSRRWHVGFFAVAVALVGILPDVRLTPATAASRGAKPALHMAVLGDSYSAGVGVGIVGPGCDRDRLAWGPRAYNELLPRWYTLASLSFQACSGFTSAQVRSMEIPTVDAQVNLATMTVGGNDIGFGEKVQSCAVGTCTSSVFSISPATKSAPRQTWTDVENNLVSTYVATRRAMARTGRLFVLTYPIPFALTASSCNGFGRDQAHNYVRDEQRAANTLVAKLDDVIVDAVHTANSQLETQYGRPGKVFVVDWRTSARRQWVPYTVPTGFAGAGAKFEAWDNPTTGLCNIGGNTPHVQGIVGNTSLSPLGNSFHPGTTGYWHAANRLAKTIEVLQAPVPSLCGHPAGTLVDGELPGIPQNQGFVAIDGGTPAVSDFDGVRGSETVVGAFCNQGGNGVPAALLLYGSDGRYRDTFTFSEIQRSVPDYAEDRGGLQHLEARDGQVYTIWLVNRADDPGCCPSLPVVVVLDVRNGRLVPTQIVRRDEVSLAASIRTAANRRDAAELVRLHVPASMASSLVASVRSRGALGVPRCYGTLTLYVANTDRSCSFPHASPYGWLCEDLRFVYDAFYAWSVNSYVRESYCGD